MCQSINVALNTITTAVFNINICYFITNYMVAQISNGVLNYSFFHMTISFAICHFLLVYFGTEPLSLTLFKILVTEYIWITTLTFQGHDFVGHVTICIGFLGDVGLVVRASDL